MAMDNSLVFIVIVNWNGLRDTLDCVASVYKMDYGNFEVIVVDNGSADDSVPVIHETYPHLVIIKNNRNLGYTGGNNTGMRYAMDLGADYVWLLNNDAVVEPGSLSALVAVAEKSPEIGLASPVIRYYFDPDTVQHSGGYVDWKNFKFLTLENREGSGDDRERGNVFLWGTALLVKRSVIDSIGYLNEKYFAYYEDMDYCVRAAGRGYRCAVADEAGIYHKDSRSTGSSRSPVQTFLRTRNVYFFWTGHLDRSEKWRYSRRFLADALSSATVLRAGQYAQSAEACLNGVWCAMRGVGGPPDRGARMPRLIERVFSWHPYFWVGLFNGEILPLAVEIFRRAKRRIFGAPRVRPMEE